MKLYISGAPGSGKSTLARQCAEKLNIPLTSLDQLLWSGEERRDEGEAELIFKKVLAQENWIIEGAQRREFFESAFFCADKIIILAVPKRLIYFQIISRWLKQRFNFETSSYLPTFRMLRLMFVWVGRYRQDIPFPEKHIILKNRKDKHEFLKEL